MLTLNEYIELNEQVDMLLEGEQTFFTDEQIEKAEFFELKWNPVSFKTALHIYDEAGEPLASVEFEDAELAMEYVEMIFDLDEEDLLSLNSYEWVGNVDDRIEQNILEV